MPGPLLTVTIAKAAKFGFWQGPLIMVGHAFLELILVVALMLGLETILKDSRVFIVTGLIGGSVLIYMGTDIIRGIMKDKLHLTLHGGSDEELKAAAVSGIVTSLTNPYWTIWWITIGASYVVVAAKSGIIGISSFYVGHILGDFAWYSLVAAMVASGRQYLSDKAYRGFLGFCGLFLIALGMYFIYSGYRAI